MKLQSAIVVACLAALLIFQLMIPPVLGLADQGDFARVVGRFGYGPLVSQELSNRLYYFVNRIYVPEPNFRFPNWEFFTSEYLCTAAAVAFAHGGPLDIRVVGAINLAVLLGAVWLLVWGAFRLLSRSGRIALAIITLLILGDTAYAVYLNSFYTETATLLYLVLAIAIWLHAMAGSRSAWVVAAFGVAMILFVTAKPQNAIVGVLFGIAFALHGEARRLARIAVLAGIAGAAVWVHATTPPILRLIAAYNEVFMGMLPVSTDPQGDLRWFGLRPELSEYSGTGGLGVKTAMHLPGFQEEFGRRVTQPKLALFYLTHPGRAWARIGAVLPVSLSLRPEFCGNYEKAVVLARYGEHSRENGNGALARSHFFSLWSGFRERCPGWFAGWALLVLLVTGFRNIRKLYGVVALSAIVSFLIAILADGWDNVKHLFLFNLLLDTCVVSALVTLANRRLSWLGSRSVH